MSQRKILSALGALGLLAAATQVVAADLKGVTLPPETASYKLKSGTGSGTVREMCSECHSVDYIITQPPQSRASWSATVDKMITVFGMGQPSDSTKDTILTYLSTYYGQ